MPIEIDWEVTDAPSEDAGAAPGAPTTRPQTPVSLPSVNPTSEPVTPQRRPGLLALPLLLALIIGISAWFLYQNGWKRVTDDIVALVRYEEQFSYQGDVGLVLRVQDPGQPEWVAVRTEQVIDGLPAALPIPGLQTKPEPLVVKEVEALDADRVRADVYRSYDAPDGGILTFSLPQFYERRGSQDWMRTNIPVSYWGTWLDWKSPHLHIRHSERDQTFVQAVGPRLELLLMQACGLWRGACSGEAPAKLYLASFVGSLEYDPLKNVEVRVEFGEGANLPSDYFLSIPSPQLGGIPANATSERYLTEYMAVRLIANLAVNIGESHAETQALIEQALIGLRLSHVDPGFAALAPPEPIAIAPAPAATNPVARVLRGPFKSVLTYTVQPGDTLSTIAERFSAEVEAIRLVNDIEDPDLIVAGTTLLIPAADD